MAKKRVLYFFQHKVTGNWIAGINKDGQYEYSPKMQDAMLFYWMQANGVSTLEHKREWVQTRPWSPPRPRRWKPRKQSRAKSSSGVITAPKVKASDGTVKEAVGVPVSEAVPV